MLFPVNGPNAIVCMAAVGRGGGLEWLHEPANPLNDVTSACRKCSGDRNDGKTAPVSLCMRSARSLDE